MLFGELREASMDEITLENVSLKTFETLLQFAYSGTLNVGKVPLAVRCIHKQYIVLYVCGYAEPFIVVCIWILRILACTMNLWS